MTEIVNRVSKSSLISLDMADYMSKGEVVIFDLKGVLYEGLILREKDFRTFLRQNDWSIYEGKNVGLICSADAIVPIWAYMLLATEIKPYAKVLSFGNIDAVEKSMIDEAIQKAISEIDFQNGKVVIKGCGHIRNKEYAYTKITEKLIPLVSSLMYGEPCSTVPIYKKKTR